MQPHPENDKRASRIIRQAASVFLALGLVVGVWAAGAYILVGAAREALDGIDVGFQRSVVAAVEPELDEDAADQEPAAPASEEAAPPPPPPPPPPPAAPVTNDRTNCDEIRGTPYRSAQERSFFLANCQGGATNVQPSSPQPTGGTRTSCDEIRGTPYRNAQERDFFLANCLGG